MVEEEIDVATMAEKVEDAPMDGEHVVNVGSEAVDANQYPLEVIYCGACGMPMEYCEFSPFPAECKEWARQNAANLGLSFESLNLDDAEEDQDGSASKSKQRSEGKGSSSKKGKNKSVRIKEPQVVKIALIRRNKRKSMTVLGGLGPFLNIKMKEAAKKMGKHFACGSSVVKTDSGAEEISIQGDVLNELPEFLSGTFGIPMDSIFVIMAP